MARPPRSGVSFCRAWTGRRFRFPKNVRRLLGNRFIRAITPTKVEVVTGGFQTTTDINLFTVGTTPGGVGVPYALGNADTEAMILNLQADSANISLMTGAWRFKIDYIRIETRMKNMTNIPVQIRLYDIVPRRDDELASTTLDTPVNSWGAGLNEQTNTGVGVAPSALFPGAEPFESERFTRRFKVLKKTTFELGAGSEHVHVIAGKPPYILDRAMTLRYHAMGRRTRFLMMVVEGGVTHSSAAHANISYGKHAIDVVTEYKARFFSMEKARSSYTAYSNMPAPLGDEVTITEDTDIATPVVIA